MKDIFCERLSDQLVDKEFVLNKKKSDTVIVLGSGPSVNELSDKSWNRIKQEDWDSIAINWWVYHWYVPTFWFMELNHLNEKHVKMWKTLIKDKKEPYKDVIWFHVVDRWLENVSIDEFNLCFPREFKKFLYYRVFFNGWFEKIEKIFDDCKKVQSIDRCWGPSRNTSSAIAAIFFAYVMGYKKIVLAGVDLNTSDYFWTDWNIPVHRETCYGNSNLSAKDEEYISENDFIITYERVNNSIKTFTHVSTSDTIGAMRSLFNTKDVELLVSSKNSKLYPMLDQFLI